MIIVAIIGYSIEKISMEITSLVIISLLLLFFHFIPLRHDSGWNMLPTEKLIAGFANPALISVLALLVLGQAIVQTGALNEIANFILRVSRNNAILSISISLIFVMVVSGFLNNTPVVVIFIPIMAALTKAVNVSASKVMIPLSFVSILGGMTTLIGSSTNLLVSGILIDMGLNPINFFDFTVPGIFLASVGLVYVLVVVPKLLKDRASLVSSFEGDDDDRQFVAQINIDYSSDFVGQKIDSGIMHQYPDISVRMIQRGEHAFLPPFDEDIVIRPRDILVISAPKKDLANFFVKNPESLGEDLDYINSNVEDEADVDIKSGYSMAEIVVSPTSRLLGRTLEQTGFHSQYNCLVMGIQRHDRVIRSKITETRLSPGDVLLVMGVHNSIMSLHESKDFLLMSWSTEDFHAGSKAGQAALIFAAVVGLAGFDIVPITISAFVGVGAVLATGCINLRQAGRALDLKIVLMIGASIALGTALQETGGAKYLAHIFVESLAGASPLIVLSALFFFMMMVTNVLSNNAAAVLFTPIAVNLANELGVNPIVFVFGVIFACNCSFITPIGYQTNLMVMGPGHYKFVDYIKTGIPLAIIIWLSYCLFAHFYYGLN